jgi:lysophospholipase
MDVSRRTRPKEARFSEWRAPDGWMLRRMDWPQTDPAAARGKLLFAGGRGDFIEKYLEIYHHWHARGWNVAAFDWRGQGASRGTASPNPLSFDPLVEDLAALIADWRGGDAGRHVVVGHSMGGHLLLRTIVDRAPPLDAAVLVAPMLQVNSAPLAAWLAPQVTEMMCLAGWRDQQVWRAPNQNSPPGSARQQFLTGSVERYEDELWWWQQEPRFRIGTPTWGWMRAAYRSSAETFTAARLAGVKLPILILGAAHDRLVSAAAIRRVAALLPNARLEMYADAAHEILRDADPVRIAALADIDGFLDEQLR